MVLYCSPAQKEKLKGCLLMDTALGNKVKKKIKVKKRDAAVFAAAFAVACTFGVSPITADVYPYGLSLVIAASSKYRLPAALGCLLSFIITGVNLFLPVLILTVLFLILRSADKETPCPLYLKLVLACCSAAVLAAKVAIDGIELFEDIVRVTATAVSIPVFAGLFALYFEPRSVNIPKALKDCSTVAFAFAGASFFAMFEIGSVPLSLAAGALFTLAAAKTRGFLFGGVCGFVCGLACNVPAIAALGILGITFGLLEQNSVVLAFILSFMLSMSGYAYLSDFAPEWAAAAMLLAAVVGFIPIRKKLPVVESACTLVLSPNRDIKLKKYAAAFSSLSNLFYTVSDTATAESITEIYKKIKKMTTMFCERCKGCSLDVNELCNRLTTDIRVKGIVEYDKLPLHFRQGCAHCDKIARAVNRLALLKEEECENGLKALAEEYNSFSVLLNEAARKQEDNSYEDKPLASEIKKILLDNGVACDRVSVTGVRQKTIEVFGVKPDKMSVSSNKLSALLSEAARLRISHPELLINDNYVIMRFATLPRINVEYAKNLLAKNGETVCGDTVSFFENDEKYFYCLISDGMGSGRDAALTSRLSAIMLEKLLTIGADKKDALQMVNKMLTKKKEEVFATIDLLEVDRITAQATIFKVGAAPTFLVRDGECHRIEAKTPPAGIMREVIAEKITITLKKGDFLVMVSDGVVQTGSRGFDLSEIIKEGGCRSAHALASRVLEEARNRSECSDDMSVCVMRFY